jgi:restriction system protein
MIALGGFIEHLLKLDQPSDGLPADKTLRRVHRLSPKRFQLLCADLFVKLGFEITTSKYTQIAGVNMHALKRDTKYLIQCRRAGSHQVELEAISSFLNAMHEADSSRGFFVSTGFFSEQARAFAAGKPIELINGRRLLEYFDHLGITVDTAAPATDLKARLKTG